MVVSTVLHTLSISAPVVPDAGEAQSAVKKDGHLPVVVSGPARGSWKALGLIFPGSS